MPFVPVPYLAWIFCKFHFIKLRSVNGFLVLLLQIIVSGSSKSMATRSFGSVLVEPSYLSYVVEDDYTFLQLSVDSTGVALIF